MTSKITVFIAPPKVSPPILLLLASCQTAGGNGSSITNEAPLPSRLTKPRRPPCSSHRRNPPGAKRMSQSRAPVATQRTKRPPKPGLRTRPAMPAACANSPFGLSSASSWFTRGHFVCSAWHPKLSNAARRRVALAPLPVTILRCESQRSITGKMPRAAVIISVPARWSCRPP